MEEGTQGNPYERSRVLCLPFINSPPSQFHTIVTAIRTTKRKCETFSMETCFVTFDHPLYIKAQEIISNNPEFKGIMLLGGFHMLMSYMGAIGTIMAGSGLKELFQSIYALNTVVKLMSRHAYAREVRCHGLAHCVLAQFIMETVSFSDEEKAVIESMLTSTDKTALLKADENEFVKVFTTKFKEAMQKLERRGPTAKLWVQYFHITTLIKQFFETERSGNWDFHITTIQQILPFCHAAGHFSIPSAPIYICRTC
ncbi:hypothetical protein AVEN_71414-1 [Araneus ventricosus]|uniref:Uncharacterized protein n=1 Tax=Araneus ventricosus TaxID=182803 RepID=A0A4Y2BJJ6_ARAVE|nr:hypothetical protein AVEN_71414-1 [Araneus ventricosus]